MEREVRFVPIGVGKIEVRKGEDGKVGIRGTASVTRSTSDDLGGFTEEIAPGAYDGALKKSDVRGLFNHDANYVLGRSGRTMSVTADGAGMHYDIPELPKSRADVLEAIQRGDVDGNSFSFTVADDEWVTRDGNPHRIIKRFEEIYDVGPVTFPAYSQTVVSTRSLDTARRMAEMGPVESLLVDMGRQQSRKWVEENCLSGDGAPPPADPPPQNDPPAPQPDPATKDDVDGLRRRIELLEATQDA